MAKKKKSPRQKHVPQRMCVACREKYDKRDLSRVVLTTDAHVVVDPSGKLNGRGAYLCGNDACWDKAITRNLLNSALKTELSEADKQSILASRAALLSVET